MIADTHIHTRFSNDSTAEMDEYCMEALASGVNILCFTDHVDNNINDSGLHFYRPDDFFENLESTKRRYGDKLIILAGMEFAEAHYNNARLENLCRQYPYDFVLGSVHFWAGDLFASELAESGMPLKECFDLYWTEIVKLTENGGFDSLAHINFPQRYFGRIDYNEKLIKRALTTIVNQNIALEINMGGSLVLDKTILTWYKECGGDLITFGSDAHTSQDLAFGWQGVNQIAKQMGFKIVYYKNRKPVNVPLL